VNGRLLFRTGPEQVWIVSPQEEDLVPVLRTAIAPQSGTVTGLSHSRTRICIEGAAAREVLVTGIPLDLHPGIFRRDSFAMTGVHHTPVLLHRSGKERYELWFLRTFAAWLWDWLIDAALPFGYEVVSLTPLGERAGSDTGAARG
jgi:sarcosine oxidase subunit gamma